MPHHSDSRERVRTGLTPELKAGRVCLFVAGLFIVLGVVGNTMGTAIIFKLMPWFLILIIVFFMTFFVGWAASRHFKATEVKEKQ